LHQREANLPFLEKVLEESPHKIIKGWACLGVAVTLIGTEKEGLDAYADSTDLIRQLEERKTRDDRIIAMLERTINEFGKISLGDTTLGKLAEPLLFERKFLMVGKVAPDIIGKDINGKPLKLSDFRGKVVILDFFADWCPYCSQMYPHERVMMQKFADKPFAIVGVNCDQRERFLQVVAQGKVTWPSFYDGPGGPICDRWNVSSYPSIYVLNADGVICYKDLRGESLERAVEGMLRDPKATPGVPNLDKIRPAVPPVTAPPATAPPATAPPAGAGNPPAATVPPTAPQPGTNPSTPTAPPASGTAAPTNLQASGTMGRPRVNRDRSPSANLAFARRSASKFKVEDSGFHGRIFIDTFFERV
jgi:thiol-disulfide isomerase/thioredoxin